MNAQRTLLTIAIAALPCACVIDGVPLPDETDRGNDADNQNPDSSPTALEGVYATHASGVTVVFGVPGAVPPSATVVVLAGTNQAQTASNNDGSFNLALSGLGSNDTKPDAISDPSATPGSDGSDGSTNDGSPPDGSDPSGNAASPTTISVRVIVDGQEVADATLDIPRVGNQTTPDGASPANSEAAPVKPDTSSTRFDATTVKLSFPAKSFPADASVAVANLDRRTTQTAAAAPDGSLSTVVAAQPGDTLYIVTITANSATAPYVITAPQ